MKPDNRTLRQLADAEFETEFEDVTTVLRNNRSSDIDVPRRLDRKIREQARYNVGHDPSKHWIFSRVPQLALVALLFFSISLYFLMGLNSRKPGQNQHDRAVPESVHSAALTATPAERQLKTRTRASPPVPPRARVADPNASSGHSWVRLKFTVGDNGIVQDITVIESCVRQSPQATCADDDQYDDYAIASVRSNRYDHGGETEELVLIPRDYRPPEPR